MALRGGCFEVTELSVAACSVAGCHACKNVCEVKEEEEKKKKAQRAVVLCQKRVFAHTAGNDRATQQAALGNRSAGVGLPEYRRHFD